MNSHTRASPNATGRHVEHRPGYSPTIMDEADDVLALVISRPHRTEAEAVQVARQMAAAGELIERLSDLLTDVDMLTRNDPTHYAVANTVALSALRARELLARIREPQP